MWIRPGTRTEQRRLERERLTLPASSHSHADQDIWLAVSQVLGKVSGQPIGHWAWITVTRGKTGRQCRVIQNEILVTSPSPQQHRTPLTHSHVSSLLHCSVISLLSSLPHAFAPKELFSSTDLLSTSFDGPPAKRTPSPLPFTPAPSSSSVYSHRLCFLSSSSSPPSFPHYPRLFCGPAWVAEFNEFSFLSVARRWFLIVKRCVLALWACVCACVWASGAHTHIHILLAHFHRHDCDHSSV